jgi:hypothetical protein
VTQAVAAQRRKQEKIFAQKEAAREAKENAEANGFMAAGRFNQNHGMIFSTVAIAVAYLIASSQFQTDILRMPRTTSGFHGTIQVPVSAASAPPTRSFATPAAPSAPATFAAPLAPAAFAAFGTAPGAAQAAAPLLF